MKKISIKQQISQYKQFLAATTPLSEALFGEVEDDTVPSNDDLQTRRISVETDASVCERCI
ncbi:hypothetical protein [Paraburkholderia bryophila]|uniref:hypothetical protein n=1 Tax=Paraburkholderia bryophila TaxID=420952 RepID=UPI0011BEB6C0|nr:hypothetical protein [Paraburkholderia bryophila]